MAKTDGLIYALEKFLVALYALVGADPPHARIEKAYRSFYTLTVADFKEWPDLQAKYRELIGRLTAKEPSSPDESRLAATLSEMRMPETNVVLKQILEFYFAVRDKLESR